MVPLTRKTPGCHSEERWILSLGLNAFTREQETTYYFDVSPASLCDSLRRFGSFFTSPLFTESSLDREVMAIEAEDAKNRQSDSFRFNQLAKLFAAEVVPVAERRTISVSWPFLFRSEDEKQAWIHCKPFSVLSFLLGHEVLGALEELVFSQHFPAKGPDVTAQQMAATPGSKSMHVGCQELEFLASGFRPSALAFGNGVRAFGD
eukprot:s528_g5.t1